MLNFKFLGTKVSKLVFSGQALLKNYMHETFLFVQKKTGFLLRPLYSPVAG